MSFVEWAVTGDNSSSVLFPKLGQDTGYHKMRPVPGVEVSGVEVSGVEVSGVEVSGAN